MRGFPLSTYRMANMKNLMTWLILGILSALIIAIASVLYAVPVFFLWNWLMPAIFGIQAISFWQSIGLCVLSGLLFKSHNTTSKD